MKLKEIFARHGVEADEKARRVLNLSSSKANITASEIEDGVTIERLADIGVPVLKYSTQVTIHGVLPGFSPEARPAGFKSVFANKNGTIGVRYVAIDGAKKQKLVEVARHVPNRVWSANLNSTGLTISRRFESREECIAAFKEFPRDLFYGSVVAGASPFGEFFIVAEVGAIPEVTFWKFAEALWGVRSEEQYRELEAALEAEYARRRKESEEKEAQWKANAAKARAEVAAGVTANRLAAVKIAPGSFLRVNEGLTRTPRLLRYVVKKRGARLCYQIAEISGETTGKWHVLTSEFIAKLQDECSRGFVFADRDA